MSPEAGRTLALAEALGLHVDPVSVSGLFAGLDVALTEWSINPGGDPRGRLRVGAFTSDHRAAERWLASRGAEALLALRRGVPRAALEGIGMAWGGEQLRWWQLAPTDGVAMASAVAGASPALAEAAAALSADCGSPRRIRAVGASAGADGLLRVTLYASALRPGAALACLERIGCHSSEGGRRFFRGLLGMGQRPWPKLWIGRSVGRGGGWKFYAFLRGDPQRAPDAAVLDLMDADAGTLAARAVLAADAPAVQIVGLTFPDDAAPGAEPRWTVYLSER